MKAFKRIAGRLTAKERQWQRRVESLEVHNKMLLERESHLQAVLDSVADGMVTMNDRGEVYRMSPAAERLFGYEGGQVLGQKVGCLMPAWEGKRTDGDLVRYFRGCSVRSDGFGGEVKGVRQDGSQLLLEVSVSEFLLDGERCFVALLRDRTETRRLEAQARRSGKIKAMITDASLDAMVTVDMDGYVQEYNAAAERMFGWRREEILGCLMEEFFIPEEMREKHRNGMARFKSDGSGPLIGGRVEVEAIRKDGSRLPVELSLVAAEIYGERLATAFLRDISERKRTEQELVSARDAAERASQAKSRFLSHMSHEIRSPLNAVIGAVNLVAEQVSDPEHLRLLHTATTSGQALLSVINEVLDFSKIEAGHLSVSSDQTDLTKLVDEVLSSAQARMDKPEVELLCSVDPNVSLVLTDPVRLRQIINVLVDNAIKFTDDGVVEVEVMRSETPAGQDAVRVAVRDTGVGIPSEHLSNVFEEFEQVDATRDSRYGGTGLGLTIARRLVEVLGGNISVHSGTQEGSCFVFTIPVILRPGLRQSVVPEGGIWLVSPNASLREALAVNAERLGVEYAGFGSLEALGRSEGSLPEKGRLVILLDERCLDATDGEEGRLHESEWEWLDANVGQVVCLCGDRNKLPSRWSRFVRVPKPISCNQLCQLLHGEGEQPLPVSPSPPRASGRLLLVEDVAANRIVAGKMLRRRGFEVVTANDGLEALTAMDQEPFDVILMDIRMPRMNGYEVVCALRAGKGPNARTPVIALTANAERAEMDRCRSVGMNEFVSKPFDMERLFDVIQRSLRHEMEPAKRVEHGDAEQQVIGGVPLLDEGILDRLVADTSPESLVPMLSMFLEELEARVAAIEAVARKGGMDQIREDAHALKSCSGTFGAVQLQRLAKALEDAAQQREIETVVQLGADVEATGARTRDVYQAYLQRAERGL